MQWTILPQVEKHGKQETEVLVKHVRFFPKKDSRTRQVTGFGKLGFTVLRIILSNGPEQHSLSLSGYTEQLKFTWTRPGKEDWQAERDNDSNLALKDKKGHVIRDYLSPKEYVPGVKDEFHNHEAAAAFLIRLLGEELTIHVLDLFAERLSEIRAKQAAKRELANAA
jgi:hypothetical protein